MKRASTRCCILAILVVGCAFHLSTLPTHAEANPERNAYFGEDAHPHQLVGRRVGHGQPHHRPRRRA